MISQFTKALFLTLTVLFFIRQAERDLIERSFRFNAKLHQLKLIFDDYHIINAKNN